MISLSREILYGLECKYRDRYRLLFDSRSTPGCSGWLLNRLAHYTTLARQDYLAAGGVVERLTCIEERVHRERRPAFYYVDDNNQIAYQSIQDRLRDDEPDVDWRRGDTPTLGTPLDEILDELEWQDVDEEGV